MNPFNMSSQINPELKQAYKSVTNPMQTIMNMARNNPSMQPIVQALQSGQDPQQLFYQLCSSRGINPQDILNQLK